MPAFFRLPTCRRPSHSAIIPAKSLRRNRRSGNRGEAIWKGTTMAFYAGRYS